ncbi:glycosyltransferase family 2 protein [Actinomadura kijaniata]|uniref:Dolichol-phosphate mannosyltransferase n=1 Tax=Actinomadura namibiensis TaxID=182080 RepID=A0A7W3QJ48_ACTNM|nr:glycosyltransferase family 2 protein [Actinomadura namibiensis]MBA8948568.1 dolichol-phosphate mannosyltransferase [Actinomadura namibiensis]
MDADVRADTPDGRAAVDRPLVSVVVPALNEAENVPGLLSRFGDFEGAHPGYEFELIVVDDGSSDGTADLVLDLAGPDAAITVVRLTRSFGSHYAISAGLARCAGDAAVVFGADLQEPPSLLTDFLARWRDGSEVVWGIRRSRTGRSASQELASRGFSKIFTRYADLAGYPPEGPSGVLVDRCVIDELARLPERNRNVLALIAWLGFTQTRVEYDQQARRHGESRWTRRKMIKLAVDSLIQFSSAPLRLCSFTGVGVAAAGLVYAAVLVIRELLGADTPSGWPTVLVVLLVLGGTQLIVIGIMGEYLWRAVEETRSRPLYVVRDVRSTGRRSRPRVPRRATTPVPAAEAASGDRQ